MVCDGFWDGFGFDGGCDFVFEFGIDEWRGDEIEEDGLYGYGNGVCFCYYVEDDIKFVFVWGKFLRDLVGLLFFC